MSKSIRESPSSDAENVAAAAEPEFVAKGEGMEALVDQLLDAKRSGNFDVMQSVTERLLRSGAANANPHDLPPATGEPTSSAASRTAEGTVSLSPLAQVDRLAKTTYDKAVVECREALAASFRSPTAAENILLDLVARELPISFSILSAQQKLAGRLAADPILANASWVRVLAQTLRDVTAVNNSITRRIEELLGAAANLRAQRRLLEGPDDK